MYFSSENCHFCRTKLTKKDFQNLNVLNATNTEYRAHRDCLEFIMAKYPTVPMHELSGKLNRTRVDLSNINDRLRYEEYIQQRKANIPKYDKLNKALLSSYKPTIP